MVLLQHSTIWQNAVAMAMGSCTVKYLEIDWLWAYVERVYRRGSKWIVVTGSRSRRNEGMKHTGVTLNAEECEFSQSKFKFLGHIVDGADIQPDPEKVRVIQAVKEPSNTFLCLTNYCSWTRLHPA